MIQPGRKEEGLCEPRQELGGGRVLDIAGREGEGGVKAESAQVSGDGKLGGAGEGSEANLDGGAWGLWDFLGQTSRRSRLCRRQLCGTHCWKEGVGTPPGR